MTTLVIEDNSVQARQFVRYVRTLPFVRVKKEDKPAAVLAEDKSAVRLSDKYRGAFSKEASESFLAHTKNMREEWDSI
jgi:hypothetical protein